MFDKKLYKIQQLSEKGNPIGNPFVGGFPVAIPITINLDKPISTHRVIFKTDRDLTGMSGLNLILGQVTKIGSNLYVENVAPIVSDVELAAFVEHYEFVPLTLGTWRSMFSPKSVVPEFADDAELFNFYTIELGMDTLEPRIPIQTIGEQLLQEGVAYPTGTVRRRADGYDWEKQSDGTWKRLTKTKEKINLSGPFFSAKDLEDILPDPHGEWIDEAEGVPKSTFDLYYEDIPGFEHIDAHNRPRRVKDSEPERKALHEKILRTFLRNKTPAPKDQAPHAVITLGVPGSGKSTAIARVVADKNNYVHVDPDQIKKLLPERKAAIAQNARNANNIVHWESGEIAERLRDEAIARRMNLIFEGVGRDQEYYCDMLNYLEESGFKVKLVLAHLPDIEEAVRRNNDRTRRTGQYTPEDRVRDAHDKVPKTFKTCGKDRDFLVLDGRDGSVAWTRTKGQETIKNGDIFESITGKRPPKEAAEAVEEAKKESQGLSHDEEALNALFVEAFRYHEQIMDALPPAYDLDRAVIDPGDDPYHFCCPAPEEPKKTKK